MIELTVLKTKDLDTVICSALLWAYWQVTSPWLDQEEQVSGLFTSLANKPSPLKPQPLL